jgi:topoisomerase IA-like protein
MPIGKNAIKRVENNGYSKVKTSAPDMENSNVLANPDPQVIEKLVAPVEAVAEEKAAPAKKCAAKKPAAKKTPAKKPVAKKPAAKEGFARVEVGAEMPYYLL